jgi:hypothetical protein
MKIFHLKAPSDSPANELKPIGHQAIVLDGEAVVLCVDGMPDFNAVHSAQVPWRGLALRRRRAGHEKEYLWHPTGMPDSSPISVPDRFRSRWIIAITGGLLER